MRGLPPGRLPNSIATRQLDVSQVKLLGTFGKRGMGAAIG